MNRIYVGFDTYNTYDAYVFGVNASGVQYDYRDSDPTYNAFYVDALFSWQFAPGSNLSLSYKNLIENEGQVIIHNYSKNFSAVIDYPQTNSISLKLLYYLDYQYIGKLNPRRKT